METISRNYHRLFIAVLVLAGLASFIFAPNVNFRDKANNMGGSGWLKKTFSSFRYYLGDTLFELTVAAKDHWFVYIGEESLDDFQNTQPYSPKEIAFIQNNLDRLSDFLTSQGIKFIVIVAPNKNTIYPQYMPSKIPIIGKQSRLDQLVAYEKSHGKFKVMDLRFDLLQASKKYQTYYSCGTHWNAYGAFIAYQDIMASLEKDYPVLKPHGLNEYRMVAVPGDTDLVDLAHLDHSTCSGIDLVPLFIQPAVTEYDSKEFVEAADGIPSPINITTVIADPSLPKLLMYRDSFATALIPFLSDHFSLAVYHRSYYKNELYEDVASEKPNVVIVEFTERYFDYLSKVLFWK
jgi:alginate O-acetyltransferase complex protein AlgJ